MVIKMCHTKMRLCVSLAILISNVLIVATYDSNIELFEGSPCDMEIRNQKGQCVLITECPIRTQQIISHQRTSEGRCGFKGKIEIVCCPTSGIVRSDEKVKIRESDGSSTTITTRATPTIRTTTTTTTTNPKTPSHREVIRPSNQACSNYERDRLGTNPVEGHIINGERANFGELPFIAAVGVATLKEPDDMHYSCAGSLIAPQYVITAAHCLKTTEGRVPVEVKLGAINLKDNSELIQNIKVERSIAYPNHKMSTNYDDIALLKLARPANITDNVSPICLQTVKLHLEPLIKDDALIVAGWGKTSVTNDDVSENLLKISSLQLVNYTECNGYYRQLGHRLSRGLDENTMICLQDRNKTRSSDACQGDSGGPLYLKGNTGLDTLVGIVSFGQGCGTPIPNIYTSVHHYLDWIESVVWPNELL